MTTLSLDKQEQHRMALYEHLMAKGIEADCYIADRPVFGSQCVEAFIKTPLFNAVLCARLSDLEKEKMTECGRWKLFLYTFDTDEPIYKDVNGRMMTDEIGPPDAVCSLEYLLLQIQENFINLMTAGKNHIKRSIAVS